MIFLYFIYQMSYWVIKAIIVTAIIVTVIKVIVTVIKVIATVITIVITMWMIAWRSVILHYVGACVRGEETDTDIRCIQICHFYIFPTLFADPSPPPQSAPPLPPTYTHTHTKKPFSHVCLSTSLSPTRHNNDPLDNHNPEYDEYLRVRAEHRFDRLRENREIRRQGRKLS